MSKIGTKRDQPPGIDRTLAILSAFRGENVAQQPAELAERLGIPRSSAYRIIGTLLRDGYLENVSRGQVRLGAKFADLLIAYQLQHRTMPAHPWPRREIAGASGDSFAQLTPSALWSPHPTEIVNCRQWYRSPPYRIGFSNVSTSNPWRVAMLHGIMNCAKKYSNRIARFIVSDAQDDARKQSRDIETMLREKVDLLLVSCNPTDTIDAALAMAAEVHVPVVVVDRRPKSDKYFLSYVSASDIALGHITAQWMVEKIDAKGIIFMLAGIAGSSPTECRVAAAKEVFSQYPEIVVVPVRYTDWHEEAGRAATKSLMREYGMPAGVWCDSGLQGAGSMQAFIDQGVADSAIPPHTGGDINRVFQLATSHRIPLAAVEYPAWMGARALHVGLDVLAGRNLARHVEVQSQIVISRGFETPSVYPDQFVENYVRWDRPADFVASHGLGENYSPDRFDTDHHQG